MSAGVNQSHKPLWVRHAKPLDPHSPIDPTVPLPYLAKGMGPSKSRSLYTLLSSYKYDLEVPSRELVISSFLYHLELCLRETEAALTLDDLLVVVAPPFTSCTWVAKEEVHPTSSCLLHGPEGKNRGYLMERIPSPWLGDIWSK